MTSVKDDQLTVLKLKALNRPNNISIDLTGKSNQMLRKKNH